MDTTSTSSLEDLEELEELRTSMETRALPTPPISRIPRKSPNKLQARPSQPRMTDKVSQEDMEDVSTEGPKEGRTTPLRSMSSLPMIIEERIEDAPKAKNGKNLYATTEDSDDGTTEQSTDKEFKDGVEEKEEGNEIISRSPKDDKNGTNTNETATPSEETNYANKTEMKENGLEAKDSGSKSDYFVGESVKPWQGPQEYEDIKAPPTPPPTVSDCSQEGKEEIFQESSSYSVPSECLDQAWLELRARYPPAVVEKFKRLLVREQIAISLDLERRRVVERTRTMGDRGRHDDEGTQQDDVELSIEIKYY